jgi:hypothetical protein
MSQFGRSIDPEFTGIRQWEDKRPGAQHVTSRDTIANPGACGTCGEPLHDWEGRADGAPHPDAHREPPAIETDKDGERLLAILGDTLDRHIDNAEYLLGKGYNEDASLNMLYRARAVRDRRGNRS